MMDLTYGKKSLILHKPSGAIAVAGNMSMAERKLYDGFLYVVEETLKQDIKEKRFSIPLIELKRMFGLEKGKNNKKFKEIIRKLSNTEVEYNILGKDKTIDGFAHYLDNVKCEIDKRAGVIIINFSIPSKVREAMVNKDSSFADIDLMIIKDLRSKYSALLYELCKDYKKSKMPTMTMGKFRQLFGIKDKYKMPDLRNRVLNTAINELNNNDKIKFSINYELTKQSNTYTHIRFIVEKQSRLSFQKNLRIRKS